MKIYLYIVLFLMVGTANAQKKSLFDQATQAYAKQDYQTAIKDYKKILAEGKTSTAVYYNLANAHYKLNHLAESIYYYNKALQLSPNDEDVKNNLMFAKRRIIDVIKKEPDTGWTKFVNGLIATFSYNGWAILAIVFAVVFLIFGVWYYFTQKTGKKRLFFTIGVLSFLLGLLCVVFAYQELAIQHSRNYAIVFAKKVVVHAEPNPNSSQAFVLHEGTKVKLLNDFNGFAKIELADGTKGWVTQDAVKEL